ncbi:MAG: tetratricopeptide repeat protein [Kofleriaceae bacterium]|nr:tetratricopeptide repeat protein [Kofleriaceae bacterium]
MVVGRGGGGAAATADAQVATGGGARDAAVVEVAPTDAGAAGGAGTFAATGSDDGGTAVAVAPEGDAGAGDATSPATGDAGDAGDTDDDRRRPDRHGAGSGSSAGSSAGSSTSSRPDRATSARTLYKDGLQRFVAGEVDEALALFRDAIARDRGYAPAWRGQGMAYERKGDRSKAARAYRTYLELAPDAGDAAAITARLEKLQ